VAGQGLPLPRGFFADMTTSQDIVPEGRTARFRSDGMKRVNLSLDQETFNLLASVAENEGSSLPSITQENFRSYLDFQSPSHRLELMAKPSLEHCLEAGRHEFATYARRLAKVELAADLDSVSLAHSLMSGIPQMSLRSGPAMEM
jgi:hypothetical protein